MKLQQLSTLTEMAKRSTEETFLAAAKKILGAGNLSAVKWKDIDRVAKEADILIPPAIRAMKASRGTWDLSKGAKAEEPTKEKNSTGFEPMKKAEAPREVARAKDDEPKEKPMKNIPQFSNSSTSQYSELMQDIKKVYGDIETQQMPHGTMGHGPHGVKLGTYMIVNRKNGQIVGKWEVTGADVRPGRGFTAYGHGSVAIKGSDKPKKPEKGEEPEKTPTKGVTKAQVKKEFPDSWEGDVNWQVTEYGGKITAEFDITFRRDTRVGAYHQYSRQISRENEYLEAAAKKFKSSLIKLDTLTLAGCRDGDKRGEENNGSAYSEYEQSIGGRVIFKAA